MLLERVLRSQGSTERVPPLHGSDSSFENAPADLPLRDEVDPARPDGRALFGAYSTPDISPPPDDVRPAGGVRIWMIAAASLVVGILIGFGSGFTAGQRAQSGAGDPAAGAPAQPFSEEAVKEPVRVEPEPVVPSPGGAPTSAGSAPEPPRRVEQPKASAAPPVEPRRPAAAPVRRVPAPAATEPGGRAAAGDRAGRDAEPVAPVATGPGSIEVVSRPSGAQVLLDGRSIGRTPLSLADVPNGAHDIRLDLPGFRPWATSVQVSAGQRTRVAASLEQ